ncbi:hypothetical protein JCM8097_007556 [Rhodosporidiobolus ruineniae]
MLASLLSSPTVTVVLDEQQLFFHPDGSNGLLPTEDPVLNGRVVLVLPSERAVKRIKVVLTGSCRPGPQRPYETTEVLHKEIEQDLSGETLKAGRHEFSFSFIIPSTTAHMHISRLGRTLHHVKASVTFASRFAPRADSPPTTFFLLPSPPVGDLPMPAGVTVETLNEDLGPVGFHLSSPSLTQSALCRLSLFLPAVSHAVELISVEELIEQLYEITYSDGRVAKVEETVTLPEVRADEREVRQAKAMGRKTSNGGSTSSGPSLPLSSSPSSPSPPLPASLDLPTASPPPPPSFPLLLTPSFPEFAYTALLRIPSHRSLHMSTADGLNPPIRMKHRVGVDVSYRLKGEHGEEDGEKMVLRMTKKAVMTSCRCNTDTLALPSYSSAAPTVVSKGKMSCRCLYSLKEVLERDGEGLALVPGSSPQSDTPAPRPLVSTGSTARSDDPEEEDERTKKTPAWTTSCTNLL